MEHASQNKADSYDGGFPYRPLNRQLGEIRLLHILPHDQRDAPINCTLEYHPLEDPNTGYEALSYTWGSSERTHIILIDDKPFAVTKNLLEALVALRDTHGYRVLWIDAICINQDDLQERGAEVLRMLRIYQRAERVVVWLGGESQNSGLAMHHFRKLDVDWKFRSHPALLTRLMRFSLGLFLRSLGIGYGVFATVKTQPFSAILFLLSVAGWLPFGTNGVLRLFARFGTALTGLKVAFNIFQIQSRVVSAPLNIEAQPAPEVVTALRDFFERSWFRRVWIVQEMAAAQDVLVLCGSEEIPWWLLHNALREIQHRVANASIRSTYLDANYLRGPLLRTVSTAAIGSFGTIVNVIDGDDSAASDRLTYLLRIFRYTEATDMRDKIYALLGLCHVSVVEQSCRLQQTTQTPQQSAIVNPSYETPVWRVYAEIVRSLTTSATFPSLDILRQCQGYKFLDDLPTWAPDWTSRYMNMASPTLMNMKDISFETLPSPELPLASFSHNLRYMTVRGFTVGLVTGKVPLLSLHPPASHQASVAIASSASGTEETAAVPSWDISREDVPGIWIVAVRYLIIAFTWILHSSLTRLGLRIIIAGANIYERLFPSSIGPRFIIVMDYLKVLIQLIATNAADAKREKHRDAVLRKRRKMSAKPGSIHENGYEIGSRDIIPLNKDAFFDVGEHSLRIHGGSDGDFQALPRWKLSWETNLHETLLGAVDIDTSCRDPKEGDVVVFLVGSHDAHLLRYDEQDGYWSLVGVAEFGMRIRWMWRDAVSEFDEGRRELHSFTLK